MSGEHAMKESGEFGAHNVLLDGFVSARDSLEASHPLEKSERSYAAQQDALKFSTARKLQGNHMVLRLLTERRSCRTIGRLPCLPSSNLMLATLRGDDDTIGFEDIFGTPSGSEVLTNPNLVMDRANWTGF